MHVAFRLLALSVDGASNIRAKLVKVAAPLTMRLAAKTIK